MPEAPPRRTAGILRAIISGFRNRNFWTGPKAETALFPTALENAENQNFEEGRAEDGGYGPDEDPVNVAHLRLEIIGRQG